MQLFAKKKHNTQRSPLPLLNEDGAQTRYAEAYRTLRTNIHFASLDKNIRSLLITSAGAGEGKTNTVANIGWTIARQDSSVLLVDCDLRRPTLSKAYGNETSSIGITGLVANVLGSEVSGELPDSYKLADIFTLIRFQKKTGRLLVREGSHVVNLFFVSGQLADLVWLTRPNELKLSTQLLRDGFLNKQQLELALKRQKDIGHRLGHVINSMGLIDESKLQGILAIHAMETLHQVAGMTSCSFMFNELPAQEVDSTISDIVDLRHLLDKTVFNKHELPFIDACIRDAIINIDDKLALLPSGPIPPNPTELVASQRLHFVLSRLKNMYDFVVIDSPPILPASDALLLSLQVDGVILVAKAAFLSRTMIGKAIDQMKSTQANLLGIILNQVDVKREGYYKYYQKYYTGYYGEQDTKSK